MAIMHPAASKEDRRKVNSELLVALTFNFAAWLVVGVVAWTVLH